MFGPMYGDTACVVKQFKTTNPSFRNMWLIIPAILVGVLCGCLVALMIILCLKRCCPSAKKYVIHSGEEIVIDSENSKKPTIVPVYYDKPPIRNAAPTNTHRHNIFKKWTRVADGGAISEGGNVDIPTEMMWRSNVFGSNAAAPAENDVSSSVNEVFNQDYITLLEFALQLWARVWASTVRFHIENLCTKGLISAEAKQKHIQRWGELFPAVASKGGDSSREINEFMEYGSDVIMSNYTEGTKFFNNVLEGSLASPHKGDQHTGEEKAKKKQADLEEQKKLSKKQMESDFTVLCGKLFDSFHHISCTCLNVQLATISTTFLLLVLKKSVGMIHYWLKYTVAKRTDSLKRRRLLVQDEDATFQKRFREEMDHLLAHLYSTRTKSMKERELSLLSEYVAQKQVLDEHYASALTSFAVDNPTSLDGLNSEKLSEKFGLVTHYTDSYEKLVYEGNLFADFHSNYLSDMSHALNIFMSRMKSHAEDIYNNKTTVPEQVKDSYIFFIFEKNPTNI